MNEKFELAAKLKEVLDNMSQEDFDREWAEITALNMESATFSEAMEYFAIMKDQMGTFEMPSVENTYTGEPNYNLAA